MIATAGLSMWISNTATTLMMLPIALSVLSKINLQHHPRFPMALLLGTAYAANLGGIATLMGTPPNVAMAGLVEEHIGVTVPLLEWTLMALPFSVVMLVLVHVLLTRVLCPVGKAELQGGVVNLRQELDALGAWTPAEKRVAWIFGSTALLWVCRRFIVAQTGMALDDTAVAMAAGVMLFLIPSGQPQSARTLLVWEDTRRLPWDILLLFGGGLTLAGQLSEAGVLVAVADGLSALPSMSQPVLVVGFILASLFLTEIMSNLALTVVMVPVVAQVAVSWGMDPLLLVVPVTMASSCAFMLHGHPSQCHCVWERPAVHVQHGQGGAGAELGGGHACLAVGHGHSAELGATFVSHGLFLFWTTLKTTFDENIFSVPCARRNVHRCLCPIRHSA